MEGDGEVEGAFWNLFFFNYKKSSASAYINLRLRPLSNLLVIASSFTSMAGMISFQVWPCRFPTTVKDY